MTHTWKKFPGPKKVFFGPRTTPQARQAGQGRSPGPVRPGPVWPGVPGRRRSRIPCYKFLALLFFPSAGRARGGPLPAGPDCYMSPIKMAEKAAAAASKPQGLWRKSAVSRENRGGRRRSTPGEAGISIKFAFLAPGAGRVPESMQKPPFSTPPLAPRSPRYARHDELHMHTLLTSCARRGLAQDFQVFQKYKGSMTIFAKLKNVKNDRVYEIKKSEK